MKILVCGNVNNNFCFVNCGENTCGEYAVICVQKNCVAKCSTLSMACLPAKPGRLPPYRRSVLK